MEDLLNKKISEYNKTVRGDYGIYLTKEQKDVIIEFTENQIKIHDTNTKKNTAK